MYKTKVAHWQGRDNEIQIDHYKIQTRCFASSDKRRDFPRCKFSHLERYQFQNGMINAKPIKINFREDVNVRDENRIFVRFYLTKVDYSSFKPSELS